MDQEIAQPGQVVGGRYEIVREIARGGMGAVFEARHRMTKKTVALKILFAHIGKNEGARQRFLREVSAPAQIGHPGIVEVYDADYDMTDGSLFVAMEMLEGDTFRDWLKAGGRTRSQVIEKFIEMLEPLAAAHRNGIVHRDLKPENVFIAKQRDGSFVTKLLDFGIARDLDESAKNVTHTGVAMGTPHYMAPEQAMSAKGVTAAADVWAIGAMMYEALTGRTPFEGETSSAIVVHACTQPHPPIAQLAPSTPPALAALVDRCLDKTPDNRPQDAGALLEELNQVRPRANAPTPAAMPAASPPVPTPQPPTSPAGPGTGGGYPSSAATAPSGGGFGAPTGGTPQTRQGTAGPGPMVPTGGGQAHGTGGGFAPTPQGFQTGGATGHQTQGGGNDSNTLLIVGGGIGVVVLIALIGVGAFFAFRDGGDGGGEGPVAGPTDTANPPTTAPPTTTGPGTTTPSNTNPGAQGSAVVLTNIAGGQLVVDGQPIGIAEHGRAVPLAAGAHTLAIQRGMQTLVQQQVNITAGAAVQVQLMQSGGGAVPPTTAGTPTPATGGTPSGPPQTRDGRLAQGDTTLRSGEFQDTYRFNFTQGQRYAIDVTSTEFDTYVIIKPPSGQQIDNDDRTPGGGNTNAGHDLNVTQTGSWQILVTSYRPGETGAYQLVVQPLQ